MKRSSRSKRSYVMKARGEQVVATRERIAAATAALHEELGPRHTTIKAIAERAGVERLTVYRHFPDDRAIFQACSAHWAERHPVPAPSTWSSIADPLARVQHALDALYRYFEQNEAMLRKVHRDLDEIPALAEVTGPFLSYLGDVADQLAAVFPKGSARDRTRVTLRFLLRFETWDRLHTELPNHAQKIALAIRWVEAAGT